VCPCYSPDGDCPTTRRILSSHQWSDLGDLRHQRLVGTISTILADTVRPVRAPGQSYRHRPVRLHNEQLNPSVSQSVVESCVRSVALKRDDRLRGPANLRIDGRCQYQWVGCDLQDGLVSCAELAHAALGRCHAGRPTRRSAMTSRSCGHESVTVAASTPAECAATTT